MFVNRNPLLERLAQGDLARIETHCDASPQDRLAMMQIHWMQLAHGTDIHPLDAEGTLAHMAVDWRVLRLVKGGYEGSSGKQMVLPLAQDPAYRSRMLAAYNERISPLFPKRF